MDLLEQLRAWPLDEWQWTALFGVAMLYGLSKGGIKGVASIGVPVMALLFGGKVSTGIVLPMLIIADIPAVLYYRRHVDRKYLIRLLPPAVLGIVLGGLLGDWIPEDAFQILMAALVLVCTILLFWWSRKSDKPPFAAGTRTAMILGVAAGFTSMVGNVAGPLVTLYLFAAKLPKFAFIGTAAWFFFVINWIKLPVHILVWKTINPETLPINIVVIPAILLGFFLAVKIVRRINEFQFRNMILILTALAALMLLLR